MSTVTAYKIRLPRTFWEDHSWARELPGGTLVKRLAKHVDIEATQDELSEIESDARYYANVYKMERADFCTIGFARSAQATLDAIYRLFPEWEVSA